MSSSTVNIWLLCVSVAICLGCYSLVGSAATTTMTVWSVVLGIGLSAALAISVVVVVASAYSSSGVGSTIFSLCRARLGSTITLVVLWSLLGELVLAVALLAKTCMHIVNLLADKSLIDFFKNCCAIGGEPTWSFYDPVSSILIVFAGIVCAFSTGQRTSKTIKCLLAVNFATILSTIIFLVKDFGGVKGADRKGTLVISHQSTDELVQTAGLYSLVFVVLLSALCSSKIRTSSSRYVWLSLISIGIISVLSIVVVFFTNGIERNANLDKLAHPIGILSEKDKAHWALKLIDICALIACMVGLISAIMLSRKTLKTMCDQGLILNFFSGNFISVIVTTILAFFLSSVQNFNGVLENVSPGAFIVYQSLIVVSILQRSLKPKDTSESNSMSAKVLIVAWLFYFITSPITAIGSEYFAGTRTQEAAIQSLSVLILLTLIQLAIKGKPISLGCIIHLLTTSILMAASIFIMCHLGVSAWLRFHVWSLLGLIVHLTSTQYQRAKLPLAQNNHGGRGADNLAFQTELDSNGYRIRSRASFASARSFSVASFLSMDLTKTWSFRSAREGFDTKSACLSFRSAREHFETRSASLSIQSALNSYNIRHLSSSTESSNDVILDQNVARLNESPSIEISNHKKSINADQNNSDDMSVYSFKSSEMFDLASSSNGVNEDEFGSLTSGSGYCKVDVHDIRDNYFDQQRSNSMYDVSSTYKQQYANEATEMQVQGYPTQRCKSSIDERNISGIPTISQSSACSPHRPDIDQQQFGAESLERVHAPGNSEHISLSECSNCELSVCHVYPESTGNQGSEMGRWRTSTSRSSGDTDVKLSLSAPHLCPDASTISHNARTTQYDVIGSIEPTQNIDVCSDCNYTIDHSDSACVNVSQSMIMLGSSGEVTDLPIRPLNSELKRQSSSASDKISDHDSGFSVELSPM